MAAEWTPAAVEARPVTQLADEATLTAAIFCHGHGLELRGGFSENNLIHVSPNHRQRSCHAARGRWVPTRIARRAWLMVAPALVARTPDLRNYPQRVLRGSRFRRCGPVYGTSNSGTIVGMPNVFKRGEHICALYDTEDEQLAVAADYLADGLRAGERAFYVAESGAAVARFRCALMQVGVEVSGAESRRALVLRTHDDAHLVDGQFDSERMLRLLNEAVEDALRDGFAGLRTCGDMSWLLSDPPGADQLVEYEAMLNQFFDGVPASGMCQYHRGRLAAHLLDHALATHPSTVVDRRHTVNPFYELPSVAIKRTADVVGLPSKLTRLRTL